MEMREGAGMIEFIRALFHPDNVFLRMGLAMGVLSSFAFGVVGSLVVSRRLGFLAGAVAHASLGGIGLSVYLQRVQDWDWMHPVAGALGTSVIAGGLMALARRYAPDREDTLIGAIWAIGMSLGLLFISATPGYSDPTVYLFGNILLVGPGELAWVGALDLVVIAAVSGFYRQLQCSAFDEEFACLRGVSAGVFYFGLLIVTGLTVVLLMSVVGIILVVALVTLPAATAGRLTRSLGAMMVVAVFCALVAVCGGIGLSFQLDSPTGPTIVMISASLYLLVTLGGALFQGKEVRS